MRPPPSAATNGLNRYQVKFGNRSEDLGTFAAMPNLSAYVPKTFITSSPYTRHRAKLARALALVDLNVDIAVGRRHEMTLRLDERRVDDRVFDRALGHALPYPTAEWASADQLAVYESAAIAGTLLPAVERIGDARSTRRNRSVGSTTADRVAGSSPNSADASGADASRGTTWSRSRVRCRQLHGLPGTHRSPSIWRKDPHGNVEL